MQLRLEALSRTEVEKLHSATLAVLEKTGVIVDSKDARDLLKDNGARINGNIVTFPQSMVEKAISQINKTVPLAAREPHYSLVLPSNQTLNSTSGYSAYVYDMEDSKSRPSTSKDLTDFAVLADALPEVDLFWPIAMPTEIDSPELQEIMALDISFRNTSKHVQCSLSDGQTALMQIKLGAALAGGEDKLREAPLFSVVASPFTPLTIRDGTGDAYIHMARAGIPVTPMNVPMAGTTAPATLPGAIVMTNAEQLATLLILKSANKDAPMVYSSDTGAADMKTGGMNYDSIDHIILNAAITQLARFYGFPTCVAHDSCEDKLYAYKAGFERNALRIAINGMVRSDLAIWMGSLDEALSCSLWDLLLDAEAVKLAKEYTRSLAVDDNTLAVDAIAEAGPGGNYLNSTHTMKNFRKALSLYSYDNSFIFAEAGDFNENAKNKVREILKSHKVAQIPEAKLKAMDEVIAEARR
jgi:trimethylamine--corrinoid protein Co-methyltransferase